MNKKLTVFLTFVLLAANSSFAQQVINPENYLSAPDPILFENTNYNLVWSSHPIDNYYKLEYLPKNQMLEKYKKMVMVEAIIGYTIDDLVAAKVSELNQLKQKDPIVNYNLLKKGDEVILDFILAAYTADGNDISIVERNVYR